MKSRLASVRTAGGLDRVDRAVQLLEDEWQRHGDVQLESLLGPGTKPTARSTPMTRWRLGRAGQGRSASRFERGQTPDGRRVSRAVPRACSTR